MATIDDLSRSIDNLGRAVDGIDKRGATAGELAAIKRLLEFNQRPSDAKRGATAEEIASVKRLANAAPIDRTHTDPNSLAWQSKTYSAWANAKHQSILGSIGHRVLGDRTSSRRKIFEGYKGFATGNFRRGLAKMRGGGRQIAKRLGFGATGQAIGGRLAMAGGALTTFAGALVAGVGALRSFGKTLLDENLKLSNASPSMAIVNAQVEMREFFREQRKGEALAGSAGRLAKVQQEFEDRMVKYDVWWQEKKNWLWRTAYTIANEVDKGVGMFDEDTKAGMGSLGGIGAAVGSLWGPVGTAAGLYGGSRLSQATDWLGKHNMSITGFAQSLHDALGFSDEKFVVGGKSLAGWDSDYYKKQYNRPDIEDELKTAIAEGNEAAVAKLTEILAQLKKQTESDMDLSGWIAQAADIGNIGKNSEDMRIQRMRTHGRRNEDFQGNPTPPQKRP